MVQIAQNTYGNGGAIIWTWNLVVT